METIKTLKQLTYNLNLGPGYEGYSGMMKAIHFDPEELEAICSWHPDHYTRIRIYDTQCVEALITCWPPGCKGPIHNYELQEGWIKMLKGELTLEYIGIRATTAEVYSSTVLKEGHFAYLNDGIGYHRFSNNSEEPSIALHFYSDKITEWHQFDEARGVVEVVPTHCDLELDPQSP